MSDAPGYPETLRVALHAERARGVRFDKAWTAALAAHPPSKPWVHELRFMRAHFRAAYDGDGTERGHLNLGATDTSDAQDAHDARRAAGPIVPPRCRWGGGCALTATVDLGHGLHWCEQHGAELARIATELAKADGL